ncbi:DEAD-box ATP-dependent RNA helicase 28-like isoform X2 [Andrographis paniculata]|uniref:DEAD-box ATP-dependent RNA helicase 28-like isoform X2 n=1 Tax=Andrographis paniculata TaxID=175694 RepID=UPI0021E81ACB|nr:DEAD-box ATP-dependent RNA helicase 28-like isoform X2 [Andrographis paniculata]
MAKFVFEPASDDEIDPPVDDEKSTTHTPWAFSSYSAESVSDQHLRCRVTTSLDHKISEALQRYPIAIPQDNDSDDDEHYDSESESDSQEEEDDGLEHDANPSFSFSDLHLSRPLLQACKALGYTTPTPIQAACIPLALTGQDICASAATGSGKTAAFVLPILERLLYKPKYRPATRVLILSPARELAVQIHNMITKLTKYVTGITCCLVIGGLPMKLALRASPDIVVGTPGRLREYIKCKRLIHLDELSVLILDEADRLLDTGFVEAVQYLVNMCSKRKQTMLFSATMTTNLDKVINLSLNKPVHLSTNKSSNMPTSLTAEVVDIRKHNTDKRAILLALCSKIFTSKVIIFSGTKAMTHQLKILFGLARFKAMEYHGNLTEAQRLEALELFKKREVDFLITTDLAARGLDISSVETVINFVCPQNIESYIHRVGRTARAGRKGHAVTFVDSEDRSYYKKINKFVKSVCSGRGLTKRVVSSESIERWSETIEQMKKAVGWIRKKEREECLIRKRIKEKKKNAAAAAMEEAIANMKLIKAKEKEERKKAKKEEKKRKQAEEKKLTRRKRRKLEAKKERD